MPMHLFYAIGSHIKMAFALTQSECRKRSVTLRQVALSIFLYQGLGFFLTVLNVHVARHFDQKNAYICYGGWKRA